MISAQRGGATHHSCGGMTLMIPDFIPYLSTFSMNLEKLLNWSIVCATASVKPVAHCGSACDLEGVPRAASDFDTSRQEHFKDDVPA